MYLYSCALREVLPSNVFVPSADGGIWMGGERDPQLFSLSELEAVMTRFLFEDLPNLLSEVLPNRPKILPETPDTQANTPETPFECPSILLGTPVTTPHTPDTPLSLRQPFFSRLPCDDSSDSGDNAEKEDCPKPSQDPEIESVLSNLTNEDAEFSEGVISSYGKGKMTALEAQTSMVKENPKTLKFNRKYEVPRFRKLMGMRPEKPGSNQDQIGSSPILEAFLTKSYQAFIFFGKFANV